MRFNKKLIAMTAVTAMSLATFAGCSGNTASESATPAATEVAAETTIEEDSAVTLIDGTYTKTADEADNGYTYTMTMVVSNNAITELTWDATDEDGNKKSDLSLNGEYVMTDDGLTWAAQSEALANYVLENQSVDGLTTDENGKTDVVSGVSISISGFVEYATALLKEASPVSLTDGTYTKTADEADNGYTYTMTMVVSDNTITELTWDATDEDGNKKSELSLNGEYVMTDDGLTWAAQSEALANYVLENQSVNGLTTDEDGKTDVVSGVSISISGFVEYATALLEEASAQ